MSYQNPDACLHVKSGMNGLHEGCLRAGVRTLTMGCSSSSPKLYTLSPSKAASEMSTARDCTGNKDAGLTAHQPISWAYQIRWPQLSR